MGWAAVAVAGAVRAQAVFDVTNATYGANGTDTLDDTAGIQSALNAAAAYYNSNAKPNRGVAVVFPAGNYHVSGTLNFTTSKFVADGGIMIRGVSDTKSRILSSAPATTLNITIHTGSANGLCHLQIEDIGFLSKIADAGTAIKIQPKDPVVEGLKISPWIRGVTIKGEGTGKNWREGISLAKGNTPRFYDLNITLPTHGPGDAISIRECYGFKLANSAITGGNACVRHLAGGEGGSITGCDIKTVQYGAYVDNIIEDPLTGENLGGYMSGSGFLMLDNTVKYSVGGVWLSRKSHVGIGRNTFLPTSGSATALTFDECQKVSVAGNVFGNQTYPGGRGIVVRAGDNPQPGQPRGTFVISDNVFNTTGGAAVTVGPCLWDVMVAHNTFAGGVIPLDDQGLGTVFLDGVPSLFRPPADALASLGNATPTWYAVTAGYTRYTANATNLGSIGGQVAASLATKNTALYFPAGNYTATTPITIDYSGLAAPKKLQVYGDGKNVSLIEGANLQGGLLQIKAPANAAVEIHHLTLKVPAAGSGPGTTGGAAVNMTHSSLPPARSLFMHDVLITAATKDYLFKYGVYGRNLYMPLFRNTLVDMPDRDEFPLADTVGYYLEGGAGAAFDGSNSRYMERGLWLQGVTGNCIAQESVFKCADIGVYAEIPGGQLHLEGVHLDNKFNNLKVANATAASYAFGETLERDRGELPVEGNDVVRDRRAGLKFTNCADVNVRYSQLSSSHRWFNRFRKMVWLEGDGNATIAGNVFQEGAGVSIRMDGGTAGKTRVRCNRFERTDVDNLSANPQENIPAYVLGGRNAQGYLLRNKAAGNYLATDGTTVSCSGNLIATNAVWEIVYWDEWGGYTLQQKNVGGDPYLKSNAPNGLSLVTSPSSTAYFVLEPGNPASSVYHIKNGSHYVDVYSGVLGTKTTKGQGWEIQLLEDVTRIDNAGKAAVLAAEANQWKAVAFDKPLAQPPAVVACSVSYGADSAPALVQTRNVTKNGFEWCMAGWTGNLATGSYPADEHLSYLALPKGAYTWSPGVGSMQCEAGTCSTVSQNQWTTVYFKEPFSATPVVFAQCSSNANGNFTGVARVRNVSADSFEVRLQVPGNVPRLTVPESVDYIALPPGRITSDIETGNGTAPWQDGMATRITYGSKFSYSDPGFIGCMQTVNNQTCGVVRYDNATFTKKLADVFLTPGKAGSAENEAIGWMVFGNDLRIQ